MKYSVIIPVYNSHLTLERAISSAVNQTLKPDEIIVVNDGSTSAETNIYLSEFENKSEVNIKIHSKDNGGASTARNFGVMHSSTEIVAFLDSDDAWELDKMENQIRILSSNPDFQAVASAYKPLPGWADETSKDTLRKLQLKDQLKRNHIQTSTFVTYKAMFNKVGGFPSGQTHAEEGDLYFKILQFSPIALMVYPYVIYGDGISQFNENGLSGDIYAMFKGELANLQRLFQRKQINLLTLLSLYLYSGSKFSIRLIKRKL